MSYTYHGATGLVTLPDREVQTFPSGLVRVTRSYVCRKGTEGSHRQALQVGNSLPDDSGAPAIDGLYIFPEPQEITRDDGFVEFRVTAYGRTTIPSGAQGSQGAGRGDLNIEESTVKGSYFQLIYDRNQEGEIIVTTSSPASINGIFIIRAVVPINESIANSLARPNVTPVVIPAGSQTPLRSYNNDFSGPNTGTTLRDSVSLTLSIDSLSAINFGRWKEVVVSWISSATVRAGRY